jgi:uncharacterized Zn finger protein
MAILLIARAKPEDKLPFGVIRCPCKTCKASTLHERVVRDWFGDRKKFKKAKLNKGIKNMVGAAHYRCQECGEVRVY